LTWIRPATERDFLAVAALDRRAWLRNRNGRFVPDGEHVWRTWCESATAFVAAEGDVVVGASVAFPLGDGRYWVHKVFVEEDRRGEGVGTRLLEALIEELDRLGVGASLTVDPQNDAALRMYERLGFTEKRFVKGYYRGEEDRFVLTRPAGGGE